MKKKNDEITFRDILGVFIPKAWLIVIASVLLSAVFGLSAMFSRNTYTTSSVFHISKTSEAINPSDILATESVINSLSHKILSKKYLSEVAANVKQHYPTELYYVTVNHLLNAIKYKPLGDGILEISVTTSDPQLSFAISTELQVSVNEEFTGYMGGGVLECVPYAEAENPQDSPNPKGTFKNAAIGFVAGAVVSAIAVWVYAAFDVTVRDKKKLEDSFELPVLGVIPVSCLISNSEVE